MTEHKYRWEVTLEETFQEFEPVERLIHYGDIIMYVTRELLPRLSEERRDLILEILADPQMDDTKLAEMIGSRRTTIRRLATEGRQRLREQERG